jgi:hypothetical protein
MHRDAAANLQSFISLLQQIKSRFVTAGGRTNPIRWAVVACEKGNPDKKAVFATVTNYAARSEDVGNVYTNDPLRGPYSFGPIIAEDWVKDDEYIAALLFGDSDKGKRQIQDAAIYASFAILTELQKHSKGPPDCLADLYREYATTFTQWGGVLLVGYTHWACFLCAAAKWTAVGGVGIGGIGLFDPPRRWIHFHYPLGLTSITVLENLERALSREATPKVGKEQAELAVANAPPEPQEQPRERGRPLRDPEYKSKCIAHYKEWLTFYSKWQTDGKKGSARQAFAKSKGMKKQKTSDAMIRYGIPSRKKPRRKPRGKARQ